MYLLSAPSAIDLTQPLDSLVDTLEEALYRGEAYRLVPYSLEQLNSYVGHNLTALPDPRDPVGDLLSVHYGAFIEQTRAWVAEYVDGAPVLAAEILHFLRNWLQDHRQLACAGA